MSLFAAGDLVRLKSGGPEMTITQVGAGSDSDRVIAAWFIGQQLATAMFPCAALVAARKACGCEFSVAHPQEHGPQCELASAAGAN